ncbi:hypothetical protein DFH08DRAFT_942833 [Mycena albidolilacea]|uniref:Uncharacterized protein n=1 Tax=Mycena albidolilacea TaxID=1033008 RepID=A0AAD6ZCI5_9AGAR|nr:hypothetical protein DFH08DRAFT_942833 [Mycena albidolilacea]
MYTAVSNGETWMRCTSAEVQRGLQRRNAQWRQCRGGADDACSWEVAHVGGEKTGVRVAAVVSAAEKSEQGVPRRRNARGVRDCNTPYEADARGTDETWGGRHGRCSEGRRGGVVGRTTKNPLQKEPGTTEAAPRTGIAELDAVGGASAGEAGTGAGAGGGSGGCEGTGRDVRTKLRQRRGGTGRDGRGGADAGRSGEKAAAVAVAQKGRRRRAASSGGGRSRRRVMLMHSPLIRAVKSERELNVSWKQGILKGVGRKYTRGIGRAGKARGRRRGVGRGQCKGGMIRQGCAG